MMHPTHTLGGAAAWLAASGAVLAAAVAPLCDVDNVSSRAARAHKTVYRVVRLFGPHRRGPAHSLVTAAVVGLLLASPHHWVHAYPVWCGEAAGVGLASHIALDLLNRKPVRVLWPFPWCSAGWLSRRPYSAGRLAVGCDGQAPGHRVHLAGLDPQQPV